MTNLRYGGGEEHCYKLLRNIRRDLIKKDPHFESKRTSKFKNGFYVENWVDLETVRQARKFLYGPLIVTQWGVKHRTRL